MHTKTKDLLPNQSTARGGYWHGTMLMIPSAVLSALCNEFFKMTFCEHFVCSISTEGHLALPGLTGFWHQEWAVHFPKGPPEKLGLLWSWICSLLIISFLKMNCSPCHRLYDPLLHYLFWTLKLSVFTLRNPFKLVVMSKADWMRVTLQARWAAANLQIE